MSFWRRSSSRHFYQLYSRPVIFQVEFKLKNSTGVYPHPEPEKSQSCYICKMFRTRCANRDSDTSHRPPYRMEPMALASGHRVQKISHYGSSWSQRLLEVRFQVENSSWKVQVELNWAGVTFIILLSLVIILLVRRKRYDFSTWVQLEIFNLKSTWKLESRERNWQLQNTKSSLLELGFEMITASTLQWDPIYPHSKRYFQVEISSWKLNSCWSDPRRCVAS